MPKCIRCGKIKQYFEDTYICHHCAWSILPDIMEKKIIPEILARPEYFIYHEQSLGLPLFKKICRKWGVRNGWLKKYLLGLFFQKQFD